MDWARLLSSTRLLQPDYAERENRPAYLQDLDRLVFSPPFRRLANKTQVHPLYENDHVHHRLIHSVDTGSVGRSLGMAVGRWLEETDACREGDEHRVSGIVQAACLAHDIGNPPFGHSGEAAIGDWFRRQFANPVGVFGLLETRHRSEFENFEGNAQGFRILSRLEMYRNKGGMRLSCGVFGAFTKYPISAHVREGVSGNYCGIKKFGVFSSEQSLFEIVADEVGLPRESSAHGVWWRRHPLVFLVEAADDICYGILDVEDAFAAGDLNFDVAKSCLAPFAGTTNQETVGQSEQEQIAYMRARGIGAAIDACVDAFKEHYTQIMDGSFSQSLTEASSKKTSFEEIKSVASEQIFTTRRKTELEVAGRNLIHQVLDGLLPVYERLASCDWNPEKIDGYEDQLARAVGLDLRDVNDAYQALHSLTDFVSGMTDRYTLRVARMISGRPSLQQGGN